MTESAQNESTFAAGFRRRFESRERGPLCLQHLIVTHTAGRQVGAVDVGEGGFCPRMLLGIVVFPLDAHGAVVTHSIQLDHDFLDAITIALSPSRDEVPAVESMPHGPMAPQETRAGVLARHLHSFDVSAMNALAELATELDDTHAS